MLSENFEVRNSIFSPSWSLKKNKYPQRSWTGGYLLVYGLALHEYKSACFRKAPQYRPIENIIDESLLRQIKPSRKKQYSCLIALTQTIPLIVHLYSITFIRCVIRILF